MAAVELAAVGVNTFYKAATLEGLSYFVFVAYSYVLGTLVLLPLPFIFPRRELRSFELSFFLKIVLLGLIGFTCSICGCKGIEYSSPTLASAVSNMIPAFTFILAIIFRMENLDLRSSVTRIKIIGTIFSLSGAMVAVIYKGPKIFSSSSSFPPQSFSLGLQYSSETSKRNWVLGGLLLASQCLLSSIWYILQTQVMKIYPDAKIVVPLYFLCKTTIAVPTCLIAEPKLSAWTLRPQISLITVVLSGFFGSSFSTLLHTWGLHLKGPLYISIFKPFSVAIAAFVGVIFLGDDLFLGSVVGAIILLLGFYAVIWGKAQEEDVKDCASSISHGKIPLLQSHRVEDMENK
ncbi:WAT1-related protein At5g40230 [Morus notabilis]|uniref:WAT1-related protein At5g40230 n=1 Tax=Morus notabilis TaxID=981085 RepID=UPI000CED4929|nr:WAT1-related protein At5g40230 [Morus notabilis]